MILDLTQLFIPCEFKEATPIKSGPVYKELNSGILWNVAFCQKGDPSYNWIEFEGKPNIGERFKVNGILNDEHNFKNLRAVVFIVSNSSETKLIGLHRADETDNILLELLYKISDFVNNDLNTNYYLS